MRERIRVLLVVSVFLFPGISGFAIQESDTLPSETKPYPKSLEIQYQYGKVWHTHAFYRGANPSNDPYHTTHAIAAKYGVHTNGKKSWQQLYAYPVYGIGISKMFFTNDHGELGNPLALYTFIDLPFHRWEKWTLDWELCLGMGFNWNRHDPRENNYYYPIGTYSTVFFESAFNTTFQLSKNLDLTAALTFSHYSNGAIKLPNLGINILGTRLALRYIFNERPQYKPKIKYPYEKEWEFIVSLAPSLREVAFEYTIDTGDTLAQTFSFGILSISGTFNRQFSHKVKFGIGTDICYHGAYGTKTTMVNGGMVKTSENPMNKFLIGLYPSFELVMGKMSIVVQPGLYIYKKKVDGFDIPRSYQRIGVKYHFWDHLVTGINIRAFSFRKADFIEWIIGYRIKWK